jgi:hypothetical protein
LGVAIGHSRYDSVRLELPSSRSQYGKRIVMQYRYVVTTVFSGFLFGMVPADDQEIKLSDCPQAVRKTFQAEAKGAKIETVTREREGDSEALYWAEVDLGGKAYEIGILEDGTLSEMNLAVDDKKIPLDRCPALVQETFRSEALGEKVEEIGRDVKYGVTIYQTVVNHKGKSYTVVVAEDGTLVEKVLVVNDEEVKLSDCPAVVRSSLHMHANGGEIGDITRSSGINRPTFEAEVKIKDKIYLLEVDDTGLLISKSLEAGED